MNAKSTRALVLGVLVSLLAFYFALQNVDLSSLLDSILAASPAWMALVLVSYVVHYWLKAMRWCDLLEPVYHAGVAEVFPVMMSGFFANNLLPAHLGELVRMYVGSKVFLIRKTAVFGTILLERILDFTTIVLMFGGALIFASAVSNSLLYSGYILVAITVSVWTVLFVALRYEQAVFRLIGWGLKPLPDRISKRISEMLAVLLEAMHSMKSTRLIIRSVVLSLLQWALVGLAVFASLKAVGVGVSISAAVVTLTATVIGVSLPAAPGFFGTIQLAFVIALIPYGVSRNDAFAGSVIFHIISYVLVMVSGVVALQQLNMRVTELQRGSEKMEAGDQAPGA